MGSWKYLLLTLSMLKCLDDVCCVNFSADWSYSNISAWCHLSGSKCGGSRQSPIDIIDAEAVVLKKPLILDFNNYNLSITVGIENDGKTVKLGPISSHNITVAGAGLYLENNFTLEEVHFHWGNSANSGSEHKINGQSSSMEIHLVHYNLEKYSNIEMAKEKSDGVLILSVLIEASKNASFNNIFKEIDRKLGQIIKPGSKRNLANLKFQDLVPKNVHDYYIYRGSFTTPPCSETVTWVIFREKLLITEEYLEHFRELPTVVKSHKVRLSSNHRPVQPLNSRMVFKTFDLARQKEFYYIRLKTIGGMEVITVLKLFSCHLPPSLSLSVIIPSLDVSWKSPNLTSDLKNFEPLDPSLSYGVRLEMHEHPLGQYKNTVHVTVLLRKLPNPESVKIVHDYFKLDKECLHDFCHWLTPQKSLTCNRQLVDSDETLSFTLSQQDPNKESYKLVVKMQENVILDTTLRNNEKVQLKPVGVEQFSNVSLFKWYLCVNKNSGDKVQLFLRISGTYVRQNNLVLEGVYGNKTNSKHSGGFPHHVKLTIGIAVGVFIFTMVLLAVWLLCRRYNQKPNQNLLVNQMDEDIAVSDSL